MISKQELVEWLAALPDDADVAIDDGGLNLCEVVDVDGHWGEGDACIDIGGIPLPDDDE